MNAGDYQGQAIKGSVQFGETDKGTLQIGIDMAIFDKTGEQLGQMTTLLYFSESAMTYSFERLRLLGWKGQSPADIRKLDDIFDTRVPVRVTAPESYVAADGTTKMGSSKLEIITGSGRVEFQKTMTQDMFANRLQALGGGGPVSVPNSNGNGNGGGSAPPF